MEKMDKVIIIDNIYFIITISILTLWLTFVTAKGGLTNHNITRKWWQRITNRGIIATCILIVLPIVLICQEVNNRNIAHNSNVELNNEQRLRDRKITKGINSGVAKETEILFENLSLAFKKQGLQYDTIKNEVIKLRDSVRVTTVVNEIPDIGLINLEIIDSTSFGSKTYNVKYYIISNDAKSLKIDLKFDVFGITSNDIIRNLILNHRVFYKGQTINKDQSLSNYLKITKDEKYYVIYGFRLKGSYYSSVNEKIFIDKFYMLKPRIKVDYFTYPAQAHEDSFRAHLAKYYID